MTEKTKKILIVLVLLLAGVLAYKTFLVPSFGTAGDCESYTCFTKLRVLDELAVDGTSSFATSTLSASLKLTGEGAVAPSCIEFYATSTATVNKLVFVASTTPTTSGYLGTTYGSCSN